MSKLSAISLSVLMLLAVCLHATASPRVLTPSIAFSPSTVTEEDVARLLVTGASPNTTYYFCPKDLESEDDLEGWSTQSGSGTQCDPVGFDQTSPSHFTFTTDSNGDATIYIQTEDVDELDEDYLGDEEKLQSIEMRSGSASGSIVDTANITIREL